MTGDPGATPAAPTPLSPELQARKSQAEVDKLVAEADKARADARKAAIDAQKALMPDLTKMDGSVLSVKDATAIGGGFVTFGAVEAAATLVADAIESALATSTPADTASRSSSTVSTYAVGGRRILVTNDENLAAVDAEHMEVSTGIDTLLAAARACLKVPNDGPGPRYFVDPGTIAAAAMALPAVLSLLSAKRSIGSSAATVSDFGATAAVMAAIKERESLAQIVLVHDDFRLLGAEGPTLDRLAALSRERTALATAKLALETAVAKLAVDREVEKGLVAQLEAADASTRPALELELAAVRDRIIAQGLATAGSDGRLAMMTAVLESIDGFGTAIRASSEGARSMLASAVLHDGLHGDPPAFANVLLVKSQNGSVVQITGDKPLWLADKFMSVADVSISFLLIDSVTSEVVGTGTKTGTYSIHGSIGDRLTIESAVVR